VASEWVRLGRKDYRHCVEYRHMDGLVALHHLAYRDNVVRLTDAEALAFARLLPEVQALVEAARHGAEHLTGNWPDAVGRVNIATLRASGNRILRALAAMEDGDG